jgi:hypothetical protein
VQDSPRITADKANYVVSVTQTITANFSISNPDRITTLFTLQMQSNQNKVRFSLNSAGLDQGIARKGDGSSDNEFEMDVRVVHVVLLFIVLCVGLIALFLLIC